MHFCHLAAIMTGSNHISTEFLGAFEESVELDLAVAEHVRIRGAALLILIEHIVHHPLAVLLAQVHKIKRYAHLARNHLCHKPVLLPLTVTMERGRGIMPVLHEKTEHIIALLLQKKSCNTRIHTARKANTHLYFAFIHNIFYICMLCATAKIT